MKNLEEILEKIIKNPTFQKYYEELVSFNEKVNLTAITEKDDVYIKHFLDSVLAENKIIKNASVVDVGTGAGFPGLPLKIIRDDINLTLVDSLNKRIEFLKQLSVKLGYEFFDNEMIKLNEKNLKDNEKPKKFLQKFQNYNALSKNDVIKIFHARAEDFCKNNREKFDVAVARAVAKLNTLLEYLLPLVKIGGIVIAYKSANSFEELDEAKRAIQILGGEYVETLHFDLPQNKGTRNLIIIKRIKPTPKIYPRDKNLPKLKPIL